MDDEIDIAVLPEMWNTSYRLNELTELADEDGQRILPFLERKAIEIHKHIVAGSIAYKREMKFIIEQLSSIMKVSALILTIKHISCQCLMSIIS